MLMMVCEYIAVVIVVVVVDQFDNNDEVDNNNSDCYCDCDDMSNVNCMYD